MSTGYDPDVPPPDKSSTPPSIPVGPSQDFIIGVYTQLSQIQKELASVVTAQKMLNEQVHNSEIRVSTEVKASEGRVSTQIRDSETRVSERVKSTEDKLSSLKERVNRVFWTGAGIGMVVVALVGWKPVAAWLNQKMANQLPPVEQPAKQPPKQN
ncbi:hypothetical protein [Paraburkholderia sp. RL17-381-BIF-C]|uniref:hypothetical protein n=1 Tax=Paraburkholderia sp. RL17-381-BIF-C TaxID=3031635 RepID=UPI0038BD89BC